MTTKLLVIVGFMGSGKTTIARELARQLECEALDLDEEITRQEQRTPGTIIEQDGESAFRELETRILRKVLTQNAAGIFALGGGTWIRRENRELIRQYAAFVIWLDATFELCWKRIEAGNETRPLARSRQRAEALYDQRGRVYELADARIEINESDSVEATAKRVCQLVALHKKSRLEE